MGIEFRAIPGTTPEDCHVAFPSTAEYRGKKGDGTDIVLSGMWKFDKENYPIADHRIRKTSWHFPNGVSKDIINVRGTLIEVLHPVQDHPLIVMFKRGEVLATKRCEEIDIVNFTAKGCMSASHFTNIITEVETDLIMRRNYGDYINRLEHITTFPVASFDPTAADTLIAKASTFIETLTAR
jgi:hypothetical protein